jgi:hypothetical protein
LDHRFEGLPCPRLAERLAVVLGDYSNGGPDERIESGKQALLLVRKVLVEGAA